ncbi:lamin tail domain-containing protein [candidate division WOR-3 bacterium]|nr:lamin tail domain-containing protein [candidate division WOR-3 bacterium]
MKVFCVFAFLAAALVLNSQVPQVVINEFSPKGTEWAELYNTTSAPVVLTGWKITSAVDGDSLMLSGTIGANSVMNFSISTAIMDNDGDSIFLYKPGDTLVDFVAFGDVGPAPVIIVGWSVSRITDGYWTSSMGRDFNIDATPTPGAPNDAKPAPLDGYVIINEIDPYPTSGDDSVEFINMSWTDTIDLGGWFLSDGDAISALGSHVLLPRSFTVVAESEFGFDFASQDVCYLFSPDTARRDQLGWAGDYNDFSVQRIPNGTGPNDGYNWVSSGGGLTLIDTTATWGEPNGFTSITVDYPAGGETLYSGDTVTVTWTGNAIAYDVFISYDGGALWELVGDSVLSSPLMFEVPRASCPNCLLAVFSEEDYFFSDTSDSFFTIVDSLPFGDTTEVYYDSASATNYYHWTTAGSGSGMRLTAPSQRGPFRLIGAKYMLQDATTGSNIFDCKVFQWGGTEPGAEEFTQNVTFPVLGTPQWYVVDVTQQGLTIEAGEDFVVCIFYDGINQPGWGFYTQTNDRAWDYDAGWSLWSSEIYCIRALLADLNGVVEEIGEEISIERPELYFSNALFGNGTWISYAVPSHGRVVIKIYDVSGREVRTLLDRHEEPGIRHLPFDGKSNDGSYLAKGVYFCRLESSSGNVSRKISVVE